MLEVITANIWHQQHVFSSMGMRISSRMTVVKMKNAGLWIHSPIPLSVSLRRELDALGKVQFIIAPNKTHHLFVNEWAEAFPDAKLFGAPGLRLKRPDITSLVELKPVIEPDWQDDFEQIFFAGIPFGNETVWLHKASRTLILTDLCQWWRGDLTMPAKIYATLAGVRRGLDVSRLVRLAVKDRAAAKLSAQKILAWPFERVILGHNTVIDIDAHAAVEKALSRFK